MPRRESSLLPIAEASHVGLTFLQSPHQPVSSGKSFYRDARRLKASEPVIAKAVSDDVSCSPEPALPDGSCFRHFLCWFHHTLFILRSMRRDRMGALSLHQSPRHPYGSISRWNLAHALKCRFLERHRRHPPPTRSIRPRPKLEIHEDKKGGERRKVFLVAPACPEERRASCALSASRWCSRGRLF